MEKFKNLSAGFWVLFGLVLLNAIGFIVAVCMLPASVPVHINVEMLVDNVGSPAMLLILPLVALALVVALGAWLMFRKDEKNLRVLTIIMWVLSVLFVWLGWVFYAVAASGAALGEKVSLSMSLLVMLPLGLLLMILGNYMPKIRQNRTLGIKLPWTFKSEECWKKTHLFGGYAMLAAGALIVVGALICGLCGIDVYVFIFFGVGLVGMLVATTIYSKITYERLKKIEMPTDNSNNGINADNLDNSLSADNADNLVNSNDTNNGDYSNNKADTENDDCSNNSIDTKN